MYTVDVDIGGTFTDGFFTDGVEVRTEKVLTTPHDITECFMSCIAAGSQAFGTPLDAFLRQTVVARVSTTVGTNLIVQRAGPRLGLIVTKGYERTLYGDGDAPVVGRYVDQDLIAGVDEGVDDKGRIVDAIDPNGLLAAVRALVDQGARMIVISLANGWRNADNERRAREIIRERYPLHYLRSVPLQIGTEVVHVADDCARTNSAILNAYIHSDMARTLYRADDRLRDAGYPNPLLVVHNSGGNARVAKTVALHTLNSGPAVAAQGAAHIAGTLGIERAVTADMGGTSFDMSIVADGAVSLNDTPEIEGVRLATPMIEVESLGAGGGSIAVVEDGVLRVGPESAGAVPGPACYGKGGMEPTVTDANLVLGYIDPEFFLGGRMTLDVEAARRASERRVARRLDMSVEEAAFAIRDRITREMADRMVARLEGAGHLAAEFTMFAIGGSGPMHAAAIAERSGIGRIIAFPFGSVFSAFGANTTNIRHVYAHTLGASLSSVAEADAVLDSFRAQALRDMQGEGFAESDIKMIAELTVSSRGKSRIVPLTSRRAGVAAALTAGLGKSTTRARIDEIRLVAECAVPVWSPGAARPSRRAAPRRKGARDVHWVAGQPHRSPVYDADQLRPGHGIEGPAIVDGADACFVVPASWSLEVDPNRHFVMTRTRG